ncbi:2-keto-4-pentenoate hydratase [Variovorax sp. LT1R16]|uniref:2-keto-4-pentenoate hydratase n=1 Tax=Variovorax sp. LT1R16 TaxID=3443728 RepID=UPI003F446E63
MHTHLDPLQEAARLLVQAHHSGQTLDELPISCRPTTLEQAYAIQDLVLQQLGPVGGWKVGAPSPDAEPTCAPLPQAGIQAGPAGLDADRLHLRGVEVEAGVVLRQDLPPRAQPYLLDEVLAAIDYVCVAVEIVESRFRDRDRVGRLSTLADLASHGAAVYLPTGVGTHPVTAWQWPHARLRLHSGPALASVSQNPAGDITRLLVWLANHTSRREIGLRRGQLILTGSCLPLMLAQSEDAIEAQLDGIGRVHVRLGGVMGADAGEAAP